MFYDRIYNIPDGAPSPEVIENDALLDKWIVKYNLEQRRERAEFASKSNKSIKSARKHRSVLEFKSGDE